MRRTLGMFAVGLAALACALPFSDQAAPSPAPTRPASASAEPTSAPPTEAVATAAATATEAPAPTQELGASVLTVPEAASAQWQAVTTDLQKPLGLEHAGDERLFIVQQNGTIFIYQDGELRSQPFLDIRDRVVDDAFERGLLGLAFHPDFAENGYFYVNYTGQGGDTRIARFSSSDDPNLADPSSENVLLTYQQPFANHNGGGLVFGPDGYLYIAAGDGGSAGDPQDNGQSLDTLLGKLLRIDVDAGEGYDIPADNPFVDRSEARDEIWDYGLRNPWRFSFDPETGDLYIADVGQNQWEEVNFEPGNSPGGLNYGWDLWEGTHEFDGGGGDTVMPVVEYSHEFGCSVTGGVVVRDDALPAWNGVYLYGDFCSGLLWGMVRDQAGQWQNELMYRTDYRPSAFGTDVDGRVYLVDHNGGLYRLTPSQ